MAEALSPLHSSLHEYIARGEELIKRCQQRVDIQGTPKLARKIQSEVKFLKRLHRKDARTLEMHLKSTNLTHLEAIVRRMESLPGVTHVLKRYQPPAQPASDDTLTTACEPIVVDIICNHGYTWVKVVARKAEALHRIWAGGGQFGDKNLVEQALVYTECSQRYCKNFTVPQVLFIFCQGVSSAMKAALEQHHVIVDAQVLQMPDNLYTAAPPATTAADVTDTHRRTETSTDMGASSFWSDFAAGDDDHSLSSDDDDDDELLTASEMLQRQQGRHDLLAFIDAQNEQQLQRNAAQNECKSEQLPHNRDCKQTEPHCNNESAINDVMFGTGASSNMREDICVHSDSEVDIVAKSRVSAAADDRSRSRSPQKHVTSSQSAHDARFGEKSTDDSAIFAQSMQSPTTVLPNESRPRAPVGCHCAPMSARGDHVTVKTRDMSAGDKTRDSDSVILSNTQVRSDCVTNTDSQSNSNSSGTGRLNEVDDDQSNCNLSQQQQQQQQKPQSQQQCNNEIEQCCSSEDDNNELDPICVQTSDLSITATRDVTGEHSSDSDVTGVRHHDKEVTHFVSEPQIRKLNLDITTLISYISNLCHGHCDYAFLEPILTQQAAQERKNPLVPLLDQCFAGKDLFICETALVDFRSILGTVGGPSECVRAEQLLARVTVIPDNLSPRIAALHLSAKIKERAKVIFGTAESFQAITVTANSGFVRAAEHKGICIPVIVHESRALTEKKQQRACAL